MNQPHGKFQFGLRKLLLWTVVVASYCGVLKVLNLPPGSSVFFTYWLAVVGIFRVAIGWRAAATGSALAALFARLAALRLGGLLPAALQDASPVWTVCRLVAEAILFGLVLSAIVEVPIRGVNWADNLMETKAKTGEDQGGPPPRE